MLTATPRITLPLAIHQSHSNNTRNGARTDSDSVMADQTAHHVVNSDRSAGESSSVDTHAKQIHSTAAASGNLSSQTPLDPTATAPDAPSITQTESATANALSADPNAFAHSKTSSDRPAGDSTSTTDQRPNGIPYLSVNGGHDGGISGEDGVGSDTDTSRAGSVDQSKEENRHLRSNSVKKPTSFKAVSVTKTFLAKTAGTTATPPVVPKVGNKSPVAATLQPVAKPRLVAKSGSGLRDIPRVRSNDGTSAPDGKMVWNKNQREQRHEKRARHLLMIGNANCAIAVPQPPPKQFTDEELKQQYGIHLTNRVLEDDGKSKWADEDEDEEDWAPEAVEWMDGTKSTINAADQQAQAQAALPEPPVKPVEITKAPEEQTPAPASAAAVAPPTSTSPQPAAGAAAKPVLTALKRPTAPSATSTTKTILRPGAASLAKQGGLGSSSEKQTLVAKAALPTPVKSPWASLPPVDKVPLPAINPPTLQQQQPSRFQRDPHGFDAFNSQPGPAREIAADTFDRSAWRDNERSNRELFNSQSGRYEPAPEYRRGSRQHDAPRQPAVLQRTSHQNGPSPAEPSAAFQTRSSAQMDGSSYSRRRGSSVSGGNAFPRDRRMSSVKPSELPLGQEEAHNTSAIADDIAPPPPAAEIAPQPTQQEPVPVQSVDQPSLEDEIARQKKVLQESREAAKRRKQEEWEREEAEKKERIRKRLEALSEQETTRSSPASVQTQPQQESGADLVRTPSRELPAPIAVEPVESSQPEAHAQRSEIHVLPVKQSSPRKQRLPESSPAPFSQTQSPFSRATSKTTFEEPQLPGLKQHSPQLSTRAPYQRQSSAPGPSASSFSSPGDHKAQPVRMQGMPGLPNNDNFLWGSGGGMAAHASPGSNVWGPPTNNRHIGNGTFDTGYSRLSPGQLQQHQAAPFSNSVPFGRQNYSRLSPKAFADQQLGPLSNDTRMVEPIGAPQINGTSPLPETARPAYQPAPIAPPQKAGSRLQNQQPRDTAAWTNFAQEAHQRDLEEGARYAAERRANPDSQARWTETFKQTKMEDGWLGGPRKLVGKEKIVHLPGATVSHTPHSVHGGGAPRAPHHNVNPAPPIAQTASTNHIAHPGSPMGEQHHAPAESTVRLPPGPSSLNKGFGSSAGAAGSPSPAVHSGNTQSLPAPPMTPTSIPQQSRFFPSTMYGGSPPPEEADHPVFGGNINRPHVRLPNARPKVKLPPAPLAVQQPKSGSVIMPQHASSFYRGGAQPLVNNQDWQARFNGLFGKAQISTTTPPSPPDTPPKDHSPAPTVSAASKAAMDFILQSHIVTTVSLPQTQPQRFEAISKPGVDDIFDGELSFGSTPKVSLPRGVQYQEAFTGGDIKHSKGVDARSKGELPAYILYDPKSEVIRMKLAQPWAIAKEIPFQRKTKARSSPPARKPSAKPGKVRQTPPGANLSGALDSPNPGSPASRGAGSRNASFQKSQKPQASVPEQSTKTPPPPKPQATGSEEKENAPKKSSWAKPPRGPPRGRGSSYKART